MDEIAGQTRLYAIMGEPIAQVRAPMAARSGAVNVIKRRPQGGWIGEMVDGLGFAEGLRTAGQGNPTLLGERMLDY